MEPVVLYCITWSYRSRIQEELSGLFCSLWFLTKATSVFSSRWAGLEGIGWLHSHIWNVGGNDFKIESGQGRPRKVPICASKHGSLRGVRMLMQRLGAAQRGRPSTCPQHRPGCRLLIKALTALIYMGVPRLHFFMGKKSRSLPYL